MDIYCAVCGLLFSPKDREQRLCSWKCRGKWAALTRPARVEVERPCSKCGRAILSKGRHLVFCPECLRPEQTCVVCGIRFRKNSTRSLGMVCSFACRGKLGATALGHGTDHPNWKGGGGGSYHTHEWHLRRDEVRDRDGWRCLDCDKSRPEIKRLHVHHLVSRAEWGDRPGHPDDAANLVTVCTGCHRKRHPIPRSVRVAGWTKRRQRQASSV